MHCYLHCNFISVHCFRLCALYCACYLVLHSLNASACVLCFHRITNQPLQYAQPGQSAVNNIPSKICLQCAQSRHFPLPLSAPSLTHWLVHFQWGLAGAMVATNQDTIGSRCELLPGAAPQKKKAAVESFVSLEYFYAHKSYGITFRVRVRRKQL